MGHFDGKLQEAVEKAITHAKDKSFYSCLTAHGFYDVADTNNGLKDWQRASVPEYNQARMTALAESIADMIQDVLANPEYGILTTTLEEIINKLDLRASMTASEMDAVGGAVGGITGGASEATRQAMSAQVAAAMGGNKFDPDVIPPISLGLSGLPFSISNCYKPGMLAPDYNFMYERESEKHDGFYIHDNKLYIGAGIPIDIGGPVKILVLRTIFGVPNIDKGGTPEGDIEGGLTMEEFQVIQNNMDVSPADAMAKEEVKSFKLTDKQMRACYYRYLHFILWQPITNQNNWGFLHWGALANNACPEQVRTALCSFIRTNGLALDPVNGKEACMISHCLNAGMAYLIGRDTPVTLVGVSKKTLTALSSDKQEVPVLTEQARQYDSVKKNKEMAFLHFMWIADILSHMTNGTSDNDVEIRKRRVAEANLIYGLVGLPKIPYGAPLAKYPKELTGQKLVARGVAELMSKTTTYVFNNTVDSLVAGGDVKIVYQSKKIDPDGTILQERSKQVLRYAGAVSGIKVMPIASLVRTPLSQGGTMAYNWHHGKRIKYKGAKSVNDLYVQRCAEHPDQCKSPGYLKDDYFNSKVRQEMIDECLKLYNNGVTVSLHCLNPVKIQAIDISNNDMENKYHYSHDQVLRLGSVFNDLKKKNYIKSYIEPDCFTPKPKTGTGEPAFHIAVWIDSAGKEYEKQQLPMAESSKETMSPTDKDQTVTMDLASFTSAAALDAVFAKDNVDSKK